jgi:hypothetical protein
MRGWGKAFVLRRRRAVGLDPSESIHPTARLSKARITRLWTLKDALWPFRPAR